jgi:uncharacterized membrane protein/GNAT superfamily N-acetyltransferase
VEITVRRVGARDALPLRQRVLRPHQTVDELAAEDGRQRDVAYFAAFDGELIVGVASVCREPAPGVDDSVACWRLRGMATEDGYRSRGIGTAVLNAAIRYVGDHGGALVWCAARTPATAFYERAGFQQEGDTWVDPVLGPHVVMQRQLRTERADHRLDVAFRVSITLKGIDGVLEVIGGTILLFVAPATLHHWARSLTAHELAQDPHDFVARHLLHSASTLSRSTTLFGAVYLLTHGIAKVVLVVALLREQLWAYPWMIALLGAFIGYQLYRLTEGFSAGLVLLTVFDAFVLVLTVLEYRRRRSPSPRPDEN